MYVTNENLKSYILGLNPGYRNGKSAIDSLGCGETPNGSSPRFCSSENAQN